MSILKSQQCLCVLQLAVFLFSCQKAAIFSNTYVFFAKTGARRKFGNFKTKWRGDCILHLEWNRNYAEKFEIGLKNTAFLPAVKEGKAGVKGPEAVFPISSH